MDPSPRLSALPSDYEPFDVHILPIAWSQRPVKKYLPNSVTATLPDPMENNSPYGAAGMLRFTRHSFLRSLSEVFDGQERLSLAFTDLYFADQKQVAKFPDQYWTVSSNEVLLKKLGYGN